MKTITNDYAKGFIDAVLASNPNIDWENVDPKFTIEKLSDTQFKILFEFKTAYDYLQDRHLVDNDYCIIDLKENRLSKEFDSLDEVITRISEVRFDDSYSFAEAKMEDFENSFDND